MKATVFVAAIVLGSILNTANAQSIHKHARHQQHRIAQGVKSKELTKGETKKLEQGEKGIHQEVKVAKADGKVTRAERNQIKRDQRKESRRIYRAKHNNRVRH